MLLASQGGDLIIEIAVLLIQLITRTGRSFDSWTSIIIVLVSCVGLGALIIWRRESLITSATNTDPPRNESKSSEPQSSETSQDLDAGSHSTLQSAERGAPLYPLLTPSLSAALQAVGHTRTGELTIDYLKGEKAPDRDALRQLVQLGYLDRGSWLEAMFGTPRWIITDAGRRACGASSQSLEAVSSTKPRGTGALTGEPPPVRQATPEGKLSILNQLAVGLLPLFIIGMGICIHEEYIQEKIVLTDVVVYKNIELMQLYRGQKRVFVMNMYTNQPGFYWDNEKFADEMKNSVNLRQTALVVALPNAFGRTDQRSRIISLTQGGRELIRENNFSVWLVPLVPMGVVILVAGIIRAFKWRKKRILPIQ